MGQIPQRPPIPSFRHFSYGPYGLPANFAPPVATAQAEALQPPRPTKHAMRPHSQNNDRLPQMTDTLNDFAFSFIQPVFLPNQGLSRAQSMKPSTKGLGGTNNNASQYKTLPKQTFAQNNSVGKREAFQGRQLKQEIKAPLPTQLAAVQTSSVCANFPSHVLASTKEAQQPVERAKKPTQVSPQVEGNSIPAHNTTRNVALSVRMEAPPKSKHTQQFKPAMNNNEVNKTTLPPISWGIFFDLQRPPTSARIQVLIKRFEREKLIKNAQINKQVAEQQQLDLEDQRAPARIDIITRVCFLLLYLKRGVSLATEGRRLN